MRYFGEPSIETKVENQGAVVSLHGKVTTGVTDVKLRETILELLEYLGDDDRVKMVLVSQGVLLQQRHIA